MEPCKTGVLSAMISGSESAGDVSCGSKLTVDSMRPVSHIRIARLWSRNSAASLFGRQKSSAIPASHSYACFQVKRTSDIPSSWPSAKPALPCAVAVKAGAPRRPEGLVLTAASTVACWMPPGTAEVFRCRSQGLASLRDGHGGPPSMG
jgi:hypothetical protein